MGKRIRKIYKHTYIHKSVKERYDSMGNYNPDPLTNYIEKYGWDNLTE